MTLSDELEAWVIQSQAWKSGMYPDLHPEETAGRKRFRKAVGPPFLPWPTDPFRAQQTFLAVLEAEKCAT